MKDEQTFLKKEETEHESKARRKRAERRTDDFIGWLERGKNVKACVVHDADELDTTKDFWVVQNGLDIYRAMTQEKVLVMAGKGKAVLVKR